MHLYNQDLASDKIFAKRVREAEIRWGSIMAPLVARDICDRLTIELDQPLRSLRVHIPKQIIGYVEKSFAKIEPQRSLLKPRMLQLNTDHIVVGCESGFSLVSLVLKKTKKDVLMEQEADYRLMRMLRERVRKTMSKAYVRVIEIEVAVFECSVHLVKGSKNAPIKLIGTEEEVNRTASWLFP